MAFRWLIFIWHSGDLTKMPSESGYCVILDNHDDVIKWKHFPRYWPFVRGIHRSPVNSPHKGQWRGAFMFCLIPWINDWVNNGEAGDLRRHLTHYDVTVMTVTHDNPRSYLSSLSLESTIEFIMFLGFHITTAYTNFRWKTEMNRDKIVLYNKSAWQIYIFWYPFRST